jgi:hypothetical protein
MDYRGNHIGYCTGKGRIATTRHNQSIRAYDLHVLQALHIKSKFEVHGCTAETSRRRPLDIMYSYSTMSQKPVGLDFTIFEPSRHKTCTKYFLKGNPLKGMQVVEQEKISGLKNSVNTSLVDYIPVALTPYGGIGPRMIEHFKAMAKVFSYRKGKQAYNKYLGKFKLRLSLAVQVSHNHLVFSNAADLCQNTAADDNVHGISLQRQASNVAESIGM